MTTGLDGEDTLSIAISGDPQNGGAVHIASALAAEIAAAFGPRKESPLSIVAAVGGRVVGGLNGSTHWGWCYIRHLWVHADWRRRGLGLRLLAEAGAEAQARDCVGLYVDTFDPLAAIVYERAGFTHFGRIDDFPPGGARLFLAKRLTPVRAPVAASRV
jgi:ribosomal protein S18 acetylase RimI-like enzyme